MAEGARGECGVLALANIGKLPDAPRAEQILAELKRHVDPILRARGWRVLKL